MKEKLPLAEGISVIAFDPGQDTGMFHYMESAKSVVHYPFSFEEILDFAVNTGDYSYFNTPIWVIERFTLYKHKAASKINSTFPECEVIGMLKVAAQRLKPIPKIVFQSASEAKGLVDDERLATYGWNLPTLHEKDAARHAVYYLAKKYEEEQRNAQR